MLTRDEITGYAGGQVALHNRIHETFRKRHLGAEEWKAWQDACREWHTFEHPVGKLWSEPFFQSLTGGDCEAIEDAILFLEVDPWYFRSGYLKEKLLKSLKVAPLGEPERKRLLGLCLRTAAGDNRREFRYYCLLAARIADTDFFAGLSRITPEQDLQARGKFSYLSGFVARSLANRGFQQ